MNGLIGRFLSSAEEAVNQLAVSKDAAYKTSRYLSIFCMEVFLRVLSRDGHVA